MNRKISHNFHDAINDHLRNFGNFSHRKELNHFFFLYLNRNTSKFDMKICRQLLPCDMQLGLPYK